MGILSFLKKGVTPQGKFLKRTITIGEGSIEEVKSEAKKFGKGLVISAGIATAVLAPTTAVGRVALGAVAKKAIAKPVQTLATAGFVAGGGLQLVKPFIKTTKKATETALPVLKGEKELTTESVKDIAKVVGVGLGVGALGAGVGVVAKKIMEGKEEIPQIPEKILEKAQTLEGKPSEVGDVITPTPPITPETVSLEEPVKVTPEKTPSERRGSKITQRVDIRLNSRSSANRKSVNYINPEIII